MLRSFVSVFRLPAAGLLLLPLLLFLFTPLHAQDEPVKVVISSNKVIIDGKTYYIHVVKPGETLYGISKAYRVSQKEISQENPMIMMGLKTDMALKIPMQPQEPPEDHPPVDADPSRFIYHRIEEKQTIYYLSRSYNVPVDEILENNPGIRMDELPVGQVIRVPKTTFRQPVEDFISQDDGYIYHRVEQKETLYSISRKYDVSIRQIRRANNNLPEGLKYGMVIRIPGTESIAEPPEPVSVPADKLETAMAKDSVSLVEGPEFDPVLCDTTGYRWRRTEVNVAMFLPLYLDQNDERSYIDSSRLNPQGRKIYKTIERDPAWIFPRSYSYLEFYEGAMLAVDYWAKNGLGINLHVYDTERDSIKVQGIIENNGLENTDLIVGPVFTSFPSNFQTVAEYARTRQIPVVSPLSTNSEVLRFNPYVFQVQPSSNVEFAAAARFLADYPRANLILVHEGDSLMNQSIDFFKNNLFYRLSFNDFPEDVVFKEVVYERLHPALDTLNPIAHAMSDALPNKVVVLSSNEAFVSRVTSNMFNLLKEYQITVFGFSSWQRFENIELDHLFGLEVHLFTVNHIDYSQKQVKDFLAGYRKRYRTEPSPHSYAWDGYDILYYFLGSMRKYGKDCYPCLPFHRTSLLHTGFDFKRNGPFDGFENKRIMVVRYTPEMTIEMLPWNGYR